MEEKSLRYRVNVSQTTKGQETFDCTVEGTGYTEAEILQLSDSLVTQLRGRYPVRLPEPKDKE